MFLQYELDMLNQNFKDFTIPVTPPISIGLLPNLSTTKTAIPVVISCQFQKVQDSSQKKKSGKL